jgi:hypothetical protein
MGAERERARAFGKLEDGLRQAADWYLWGTVREDYRPDGEV